MILKTKMYAVGPEDGEGWEPIEAVSKRQAKSFYMVEHGESNGCYSFNMLEARRVENWDGLQSIMPYDWLCAGLSHSCKRCHEQVTPDDEIEIESGDVYHAECYY